MRESADACRVGIGAVRQQHTSDRHGVGVMVANRDRPGALRRVAAVVAPLLVVGVIIVTVVRVVAHPLQALGALLLLVALMAAGWHALTRTGGRRVVATVAGVIALVGLLVLAIGDGTLVSLVVRIVAIVVAAALARYALG